MNPWRSAANSAGDFRRGDAQAPKEMLQRYLDPFGKAADHSLLVERNDLYFCIREIFWNESAPRAECVVGIWYRQLDIPYPHFENIAGLGTLNKNRAG